MMHEKHLAWAVALAIVASVPRASAHGGEDHAAPAAPSAASTGTEHVVSGETAVFSVVIKYPARKAEGPLPARVYVARADSSAPVEGARVRLELKGGLTFAADAGKTTAAGVYEVALPAAPEGATANGVVSVEAGGDFDLVLVGDLRFGAIAPAEAPAGTTPGREVPLGALAAAAGALAVLSGGIGYALGRRSRRKPPAPTLRPEDRSTLSQVAS
ncbi:hypothetical protein BE21_19085 [Sorangium cellulosum]|uniref:Uncharacterized protein n=1 Tax=Sorangium cellulosum TaxID=56 RepID=A0A150TX27_SORCE|nr:hypothetical protein BE21_19085 [Sorangium cellulosum]